MATDWPLVQYNGNTRRFLNGLTEVEMTETTNITDTLFDDGFKGAIDPYELFEVWFAEAVEKEVNDPTAMVLATVDGDGLPNARTMLLNGRSEQGFVFYTNYESTKGEELLANPKATLLFHWKSLRRQVRIRGLVEKVSDAEADAYYQTRPRGSRIGAHASEQSRPLASREALIERNDALEQKFGDGDIPRPGHWSGFRVVPISIEFWKDGAFRLHDRVLFTGGSGRSGWSQTRLNP